MRIIDGFVLREIAGECVVVGEGLKQIDFNKLIGLNPSAAYLWREVQGKEFDAATLEHLLTRKYDIDETTARNDVDAMIKEWLDAGLIEE